MKKKEHIVKTVKPGSIAEELEIAPGDKVLAIDNTNIEGFSRSDLDVYSKLLGVNFNYNGYGYAFGTNLKGRDVVKGETIDINLKVKYLEVEDNSTNSDL